MKLKYSLGQVTDKSREVTKKWLSLNEPFLAEDDYNYAKWLLTSLADPEQSEFNEENSGEDSLEAYWFKHVGCDKDKINADPVYRFLIHTQAFFIYEGFFDMAYNTEYAVGYIKYLKSYM